MEAIHTDTVCVYHSLIPAFLHKQHTFLISKVSVILKSVSQGSMKHLDGWKVSRCLWWACASLTSRDKWPDSSIYQLYSQCVITMIKNKNLLLASHFDILYLYMTINTFSLYHDQSVVHICLSGARLPSESVKRCIRHLAWLADRIVLCFPNTMNESGRKSDLVLIQTNKH